jgi:hypothetical protein
VTYRRAPALIVALVCVAVAGGGYLLLRWSDDATAQELIVVGVVWCGFWGLLLASLARRGTVVDSAGIRVRHMFRTRAYPWPDIADIRVEPHTPLVGTTDERNFVVIYDANLRRHALPMVSGRTAAELAETRDDLCARWETHRGAAWSPSTGAVEAEVDWRQRRRKIWERALIAALIASLPPFAIIAVAAATSGMTVLLVGVLALVTLPVAVFALVATVGLERARR